MSEDTTDDPDGLLSGDPSVELSSNRTAMSFERTRMSADRTLMSVLRTSLSMISFGFTIYQIFRKIAEQYPGSGVTSASARNFGVSLLLLGVGLLIFGLLEHVKLLRELDKRRGRLHVAGLLRSSPQYQTSATAVVAVLLLVLGILSVAGIVLRAGPFG